MSSKPSKITDTNPPGLEHTLQPARPPEKESYLQSNTRSSEPQKRFLLLRQTTKNKELPGGTLEIKKSKHWEDSYCVTVKRKGHEKALRMQWWVPFPYFCACFFSLIIMSKWNIHLGFIFFISLCHQLTFYGISALLDDTVWRQTGY